MDCNAAVQAALAKLQGTIEESGACVECGPLPSIRSIEILLVQLFQNLISNGIKYRAEEAPRIRVSADRSEEG